MIRFLIKRFAFGLLVLCSVIVLISSIIYLAPVDPTRLTFGQRSDNETVLLKQKELGLDQPLSTQMWMYLKDISPILFSKGEPKISKTNTSKSICLSSYCLTIKSPHLRYSYQSGRKVSDLLIETIPKTLILALSAFLIAAIFGILLGIIAALSKGKPIDNIILGHIHDRNICTFLCCRYILCFIFWIYFSTLYRLEYARIHL